MSRAYSGAYAMAQTGAGPSSWATGVTSAKAAAKEAIAISPETRSDLAPTCGEGSRLIVGTRERPVEAVELCGCFR